MIDSEEASMIFPSSIFEANSYLIEKKTQTLIEYAAFFGSIQIIKYLHFNNVELDPSLWIYVIQKMMN